MIDKWEIEMIRKRDRELGLSPAQAEKIWHFENDDKGLHPPGDHFSFWEEWDYKYDFYRDILSAEQLVIYQDQTAMAIKLYEDSLIKRDEDLQDRLAFMEEWVEWLKEFRVRFLRESLSTGIPVYFHRAKAEYLAAEYRQFLIRSKKKALINHYRHHRLFAPNTLRHAMLYQEVMSIWPSYSIFFETADAAVRAVGSFLLDHYSTMIRENAGFFQQISAELEQKQIELTQKHIPQKSRGGWHITISPKYPINLEEEGMMSLIIAPAQALT
ncbi:MAG TPA: hypothetical protein VN824_15615 [Puia sp.]|nr:hypothetical protein [Puia sp.]